MLIIGRCHLAGGIRPGKVMEVPDERAARLVAAGLVEEADQLATVDPVLASLFVAPSTYHTMEDKQQWPFGG